MSARIKYRTAFDLEIKAIECTRETDKFVYIPCGFKNTTRREAKMSGFYQYHDSYADAHAYLLAKAERDCESAAKALESAESRLASIIAMPLPAKAGA